MQGVCSLFDCPHSTPQLQSEGPYIVRSQDIREGVFSKGTAARVSEQTYLERTGRAVPSHGDLLFSREGTYFGIAAEVPANIELCLGQRMVLLRPTSHALDFQFLKYWLNSPIMVRHIRGFRDGSVAERLNVPTIRSLPVVLPPIREQQLIAQFLSALDQKIELGLRVNETLETIARAIFKSWFVDFDPARSGQRMVSSERGPMPEGWSFRPLRTLIDLEKGLSYQGKFLSDSGIPMVNLGCFIGNGEFLQDAVKFYVGEHKQRHIVRGGDLVIANTDITQKREVLGSPALLPGTANSSYLFTHHVYAVRFKPDAKDWATYVYYALLRPEFRERAIGYATGTTVLALPRDAVLDYRVADPGKVVMSAFAELLAPTLKLKEKNSDQSRTLAEMRDTLLPKLMSGEIRLKDSDKIVETRA